VRKRMTYMLVAGVLALITLLMGSAPALADQDVISGTPTWQNVPVTTGQSGYVQQINGQNYWFRTGTDSSTGQTVVQDIKFDLGHVYGYWWTATNGDQLFIECDQTTGNPTGAVDYTQLTNSTQNFQETYTVMNTVPTTVPIYPPSFVNTWIPNIGAYAPSTLSGQITETSAATDGWASPYWGAVAIINPNPYDVEYSYIEAQPEGGPESLLSSFVLPGTTDSNVGQLYSGGDLAYMKVGWSSLPSGYNDVVGSAHGTSVLYNGQTYPITTYPQYDQYTGGTGTFVLPGTLGTFQFSASGAGNLTGGAPSGYLSVAVPTLVPTYTFTPWAGQTQIGSVVQGSKIGYSYQTNVGSPIMAGFGSMVGGTAMATMTNPNSNISAVVQPITFTGGGPGWSGYIEEVTNGPGAWTTISNSIQEDVSFPQETLQPGQTVSVPASLYYDDGTGKTPYAPPSDVPQMVSPGIAVQEQYGGYFSEFSYLTEQGGKGVQDNYTFNLFSNWVTTNNTNNYNDYYFPSTTTAQTQAINIPPGQYVANINGTNIPVIVPLSPYPATMTAGQNGWTSTDVDNGRAAHIAILQDIASQLNQYASVDGVSAQYAQVEYGVAYQGDVYGYTIQLTGSVSNAIQFSTSDVQGNLFTLLGLTPVNSQGVALPWPNDPIYSSSSFNATYWKEYVFNNNMYGPTCINDAAAMTGPSGNYYAWVDGSMWAGNGYQYGDYWAVTGFDSQGDARAGAVEIGWPQVDANSYFNYLYRGEISTYPEFGSNPFYAPVIIQ